MPFDANDPDTKAAIDKINADFSDKLETEQAKNRNLLDEFKKTQAALRAKDGVDPADLAKAEAEAERLKTELTAAQKTAKDMTTAAEKATKALEAESTVTHRLVAENGLMKALADAGVTDPAYLEAAKAMHISSVKVAVEGDARKPMYGDKELDAAVKEWAASDVGKKFVSAPNNSGGGSGGGGGGGTGTADLSKLPPVERITAARAAGAQT